MQARRLAPCRMLLCASPAYLAEHGVPRTLDDLAQHNCLLYTLMRLAPARRWPFGEDGRIGCPVRGTLEANNGDALLAAALAGTGIIYQPAFIVAEDLRAGRLVNLTLDQPTMHLAGVFAVYPADRSPPAKIRAMIDFLVAAFHPQPPWVSGVTSETDQKP